MISINYSIDGAPIFDSSNTSIYPILCTINELNPFERRNHFMLSCIWFGSGKPKSMNGYLRPFTNEAKKLLSEGFTYPYKGQTYHKRVVTLMGVCDSVARSLVQGVKQFNGKYGCGLYLHPGITVSKGRGFTRVYSVIDGKFFGEGLRTHDQSLMHAKKEKQDDRKGIKKISVLCELPNYDIIHNLDSEWVHCVGLGVYCNRDQGNPPQLSLTTLSVNVIDADDQNPVFSHDQYRVIIPDGFQNKKLILPVKPVPIKAVDQDIGINAPIKYTAQNGILPFLHLNSQTAEITLIRNLLDHELLTPSTIVIKATQIDNPDRFSLATVIISRESSINAIPTVEVTRPVKFILQDFTINVPENTPRGSVILSTGLNKIGSNLKYWLESTADENDKFSVSSVGEIILKEPLDYEKKTIHNFLIHVTDGINNDTARVHVAVEDINEWEPRFRHPRYEFHAHTLREGSIIGKVEAADGDRGDRVTLSLRGPDARNFQIRDNGELILTSSGPFNSTLARLVAVATDSGKPPRTSMIPLIVYLPSTRSNPIAARAAPAWLSGSIFLVAGFGVVLGLLGIVILILILYIYKQKRPKNEGLVNSIGTGYRGKSPVPSALNPSPQILGANVINDISEDTKKKSGSRNKNINNPVFGKDNQSLYNAAEALSTRHIPGYNRHKVAPLPIPPSLSATSNIPNIGGLVQNMNDLSTRANIDTVSQDSSNYSVDPPDSLIPVWPAEDSSRHVKKLSWNDDRIADNVTDDKIEQQNENNYQGPDKLNLTVYF